MTQPIDRLTGRLLACASAVVLAATTIGVAAAAPGNPGVPADPTVLMHEDFESNPAATGDLTKLADYDSQYAPFTADPAWLDAVQGNGLIVNRNTTDASINAEGFNGDQTGRDALRALAEKIGEINGTGADNWAVTAWTSTASPGADKVEFQIVDPLDLAADGRFLTIAANVGVASCSAAHPALNFFLDDDGTETKVNAQPLDPCPAGATSGNFYATSLTGGKGALFTGDKVGVLIRNGQGSGGGNDHAFDDIRVLDVTPQLDKQFVDEGSKLASGDVTDLVLTVTNTSELGDKTGWSFVDHLPKGLTVAGDATNNCDADIAAPKGSTIVDVSNGSLAEGQVACDITVPVTAKKGGVFKNSAANIESVGLNKPGSTSIQFLAPPSVKAPDTGEQRTSMWQFYAALLGGLALAGVGAQRLIARRR